MVAVRRALAVVLLIGLVLSWVLVAWGAAPYSITQIGGHDGVSCDVAVNGGAIGASHCGFSLSPLMALALVMALAAAVAAVSSARWMVPLCVAAGVLVAVEYALAPEESLSWARAAFAVGAVGLASVLGRPVKPLR